MAITFGVSIIICYQKSDLMSSEPNSYPLQLARYIVKRRNKCYTLKQFVKLQQNGYFLRGSF